MHFANAKFSMYTFIVLDCSIGSVFIFCTAPCYGTNFSMSRGRTVGLLGSLISLLLQ